MKNTSLSLSAAKNARERILFTAHELFYRDGIRATGVDRLIARAEVTKTTFYRHFPSKNELVMAFLTFRHERWRSWFISQLEAHGNGIEAVCPALAEWFESDDFRGCAFINSLEELGGELPQIVEITRLHKDDLANIIAGIVPTIKDREKKAQAITLAIDGAIIRAQFDAVPEVALAGLQLIITSLFAADDEA